jgi:hypothetical protein
MGHSRAQKAKTHDHERMIKLASKRFREEGVAQVPKNPTS